MTKPKAAPTKTKKVAAPKPTVAVVKPAPVLAPKPTPKAENVIRRLPPVGVIQILKTTNPYKGHRAEQFALMVDGMTVEQFVKAQATAKLGTGTRALKRAIEGGWIEIKEG